MKLKNIGRSSGRTSLSYLTVIALVSTLAAVDGRMDLNVALNRPTFMSSVWYDPNLGGYFVSSRAVDGNNDPDSYKVDNSCVHTQMETNPWLAVDLGEPVGVTGVLFTNRGDSNWGYRSTNFIIGLTDVSPDTTAPTLWNYDVCGQWPGVVGNGATVYMKCQKDMPYRRYLIVQVHVTSDALNFCEIEVYVRSWGWRQETGIQMVNKVASSFQVAHQLLCINKCLLSPICDSCNYRSGNKTCQLNTHDTPPVANSADIVADNEWDWWRPVFTTVV